MEILDRFFVVARCAALLVACAFVVEAEASTNGGPELAGQSGAAASTPQSTATTASPMPSRRHRPIFVCRGAGPVIFSDRPCGQFAEMRDVSFAEAGPGRIATVVRPPAPATTRPQAEPRPPDVKPDERTARCQRLLDQRDRLNARMRDGYPARQAAQLWNRWRELAAQVYAERC
jgi:hypothetical protein